MTKTPVSLPRWEMVPAMGLKGVRVPPGFAMTAAAYWHFLKENHLDEILEKEKK